MVNLSPENMKKEVLISVAAFVAAASAGSAAVSPIAVSGWNYDMVLNGSGPYNTSVNGTMDGGFGQFENWTWVEAGTYTNADGNLQAFNGLVAGVHSSLTGSGTFEFQDFSSNNVVGLNAGQTGILVLDTPASYSALSLFGASGFGGKAATVTLTFSDLSTTVFAVTQGEGIGTDWFNTAPDKAFAVGGRASNKSEEGFTRLFYGDSSVIGINESAFSLSATDQAKLLSSVSITNDGGDRMAIFAISGAPVPEPSIALLGGLGIFGLLRRRRA